MPVTKKDERFSTKYPGLNVLCQTLLFVEGDAPNLLVGLFGETGLSGCSLENSSSAARATKKIYSRVTDHDCGSSWTVAEDLFKGAHAACHCSFAGRIRVSESRIILSMSLNAFPWLP